MEIYTTITTRKTKCAICGQQIDYGIYKAVIVIGTVSRRAHISCIRSGLKAKKGKLHFSTKFC